MVGVVLLVLLVLPFVELALFVAVAGRVGVLGALVGIIAFGAIGAWLVKREGLGAWRRAQARLSAGEIPADELVNGLLLLFAGLLLVLPGFVSDIVGVLLLIPPVRLAVRALLLRKFEKRVRAAVVKGTDAMSGIPFIRGGPRRVDTGPAAYDVNEVRGHGAGRTGPHEPGPDDRPRLGRRG